MGVKKKCYEVKINLGGFTASTNAVDSLELAEKLKDKLGSKAIIKKIEKKEIITIPDLPFDLSELQSECNTFFNYNDKQTLEYAQSLFKKNLITNPVTNSRYLPPNLIIIMINNFLGKYDFDTSRLKVVFNNTKAFGDFAIVPSLNGLDYDISALSSNESNVYHLIVDKLHASVGYPKAEEYKRITLVYEMQDNIIEFEGNTKEIIDEGFTKYLIKYQADNKDTCISLPDINIGDVLEIKNKKIEEITASIQ